MKWCVLVLVFAGLTRGDNIDRNVFNCPELNAQDEIDLDKVRALPLSPFAIAIVSRKRRWYRARRVKISTCARSVSCLG